MLQLVPALSKWGGTTVGLTQLAIGAMGLYETYLEGGGHAEGQAEDDLAGGMLRARFGQALRGRQQRVGWQPHVRVRTLLYFLL